MKRKISITISEKTLNDIDSIIDNVYIRNRSQAIELLINNSLGENKVAVILAGGKPEDLKVNENEFRITIKLNNSVTLIENTLKKLKEEGFKQVYLIARKEIINSVFSIVQNGTKFGLTLEYIEEKESNGSAESLKLVRGKIKTNFLVIYGDVIFDSLNLDELWNEHIKRKGMSTLLLTTTPDPSKKGVVKIEGTTILEFIQKPKSSEVYLGFSSIFITQPEIMEYIGNSLEEEIFPEMAKKNLLNGYLTTSKIIKIKSKKDLQKLK